MLHGINHIAIPVRNLDVSDRFYRGLLGLRAVGARPGMKFYSAGLHHHDMALIETGEMFPVSGFAHFCLDVEDEQSLATIYGRCRATGARILEPVDHTVMRAFYLVDPDDHIVELGVDVSKSEWGPWPNPFGRDVAYPRLLSLADGWKLFGSARIASENE
ncbi:VOC family protein [Acidithiobacillus sp. AMEEHan]|uniref:VOC family protein n=1 Tax=Acidithiobacillus sp. AMEEHan TaxID=2994951 RepID=UPI0027E4FC58|nr:VOC family protein [Acidithiobacillus sp. AMEEHan]